MRLIRLAGALVALSVSWAVSANPAINSNVSGSIAGPAAATTQMVASQAQVRLDRAGFTGNLGSNLGGKDARTISESPAGTDDSRGWLMALVAVLLIGHQLRRKHRFLRPQRFSDL
jgi:hypothetical protein